MSERDDRPQVAGLGEFIEQDLGDGGHMIMVITDSPEPPDFPVGGVIVPNIVHTNDAPVYACDLVKIRRNSDGAILTQKKTVDRFWWEEGNGACDCNREAIFNMGVGLSEGDHSCGEGRFSIQIIENGKVVYDEFENDQSVI